MRYSSGTLPTTYNYTGQRLDSSTGLLYYGARTYDPALMRFIQPDTLVPQPGNPQSLNRSAYVLNNPLKYTDPTGHVEDSWGDIGGGNPGAWAINPYGWEPQDPFASPLEVNAAEGAQAQAAAESELAVVAKAEVWGTVDQNVDIGGVVRAAEGKGGRWVQTSLPGFEDTIPSYLGGGLEVAFTNITTRTLDTADLSYAIERNVEGQ